MYKGVFTSISIQANMYFGQICTQAKLNKYKICIEQIKGSESSMWFMISLIMNLLLKGTNKIVLKGM